MEIANFPEKIKEKAKSLVGLSEKREGTLSAESKAIKLTFIAGVSILVFLIITGVIIVKFIAPKTSLKIEISGPEVVKAGELITYTVSCKNTGNVALERPELIFNYPSHSLPEKGNLTETVKTEEFKNFLYPGEVETFQFKTRLFGISEEKKEVKSWLNYKTKSAPSPQMSSVVTFSTQISEVPIDLELDIPSKIPISTKTKTEFKFGVRYASLIDYPLSNLILKIDYPSDFTLKESRPKKTKEKENFWEISTLKKNEVGEIELWGEFPKKQEIGKEVKFSAQLSIIIYGEEVLLKKTLKNSLTYEPIFLISQKINGKEGYVVSPGEKLHYQIHFKHVGKEPLRDLNLISRLEGNLYDLFTIECPEAKTKMGDNSIVWSGEKIPKLRYLTPGEEGEADFWINLKSDYKPKSISEVNAVIKHRISLGGFEQEFRTKVNSDLKISQEGYYRDKYGFFENSGYPPQVNKATTYTIVWKVENYYNSVGDVKIKASLPVQVNVKSIYHPSQGEVNITGEYLKKGDESIYPGIPAGFRFEHNLNYGMISGEVLYLKIILKKEVPIASKNLTPTGYFGPLTLNAVIEFQEKYRKEILSPQNLKIGTGYVDEFTRLKLNELLTKGVPSATKEIVWKLEKIDPGTGIFSEPLITAFQINFIPTLAQKGELAELISKVMLSGKDQWTGESVFTEDEPIDTSLPDDSTIEKGEVR